MHHRLLALRKRRPPGNGTHVPWLRRGFVVVLLLALMSVVSTFGPPFVADSSGWVTQAHATPKPGQPGGNHSDPGDKKGRHKTNDNNRNRTGPNDRNRPGSQNQGSQQNQQRQGPQSRIDATQIDRTNQNDQSTAGRSGSRSGTDEPSQNGAPDQAADTDRAGQPTPNDQSAIPPRQQPLSPEQRQAYNNIRDLPSPATRQDLADRVADGSRDYNKDPFNTGSDTDLNAVADHLLPKRRIAEMPGFSDLDRDTQRRIADSPENIYAATPFENSSRRDRTFAEYFANGQGAQLDPSYRDMRIAQENEAYGILHQRIDEAWAQQFGRPRVTDGPLEADLSQPPLEVDARPSPPEIPAVQASPEVPMTQAPVEVPPISVAPQMPPPAPTVAYPLPPVRPAAPPVVGAPVAPTTFAAPPPAIVPTPPPLANPAVLPAWSTPPPGPVAIPSIADPLSALRTEQTALGIEAASIADRQEALQAIPGFDTNPAAIAEYQALQSLVPQVAARQTSVASVLAHPPAALAPPPSLWQQTVSGAKSIASAVGSAVSSVWSAISSAGAVPVPVGPALPVPVP